MALVGGEVGEGAGQEGREVGAEVAGGRAAAGAVQFQEAVGGEVEVEGQPVGLLGDDLTERGSDERLSVAGQAAGEVVGAVLQGEVANEDLPSRPG